MYYNLKKKFNADGTYWLEQNPHTGSRFAIAAQIGHRIWWLMSSKGFYLGPVKIGAKIYPNSYSAEQDKVFKYI